MKNISVFLSENVQFLEVKISIYLNRRVFVMFKPSVIFQFTVPRWFLCYRPIFCKSVVSYVAFVLSLMVAYLSFFLDFEGMRVGGGGDCTLLFWHFLSICTYICAGLHTLYAR